MQPPRFPALPTDAAGAISGPGRGLARWRSGRRHEVPTHLNVEDRVFYGLSLRQLMYLTSGLAGSYGLWSEWTQLPDAIRLVLAVAGLGLAVALALVRPGGHGLDEWAVIGLRYVTLPKRAVWRPGGPAGALLATAAAPRGATNWPRWAARRPVVGDGQPAGNESPSAAGWTELRLAVGPPHGAAPPPLAQGLAPGRGHDLDEPQAAYAPWRGSMPGRRLGRGEDAQAVRTR
jgi:hypothetical protein